jgi:hypothetical protein
MSFNISSERKPTPPNTPPGSPRTPDEKPEKTQRAAWKQLTKHRATRSLDVRNVKKAEPPPREKRLMVEPPEEKAWKPGKVSTPVLIDGFVNGLIGIEGAPPIDENFMHQLGQLLSNKIIQNELIPKFDLLGPQDVETALAKMHQMKVTDLRSGTPLYYACLVALEARKDEAPKSEPARKSEKELETEAKHAVNDYLGLLASGDDEAAAAIYEQLIEIAEKRNWQPNRLLLLVGPSIADWLETRSCDDLLAVYEAARRLRNERRDNQVSSYVWSKLKPQFRPAEPKSVRPKLPLDLTSLPKLKFPKVTSPREALASLRESIVSPRTAKKSLASSTPKFEPLPSEPLSPPASELDPKGVDAMAGFISHAGDPRGMKAWFDVLRQVILQAANMDAVDSWIDAVLKGKSTSDLEAIVAAVEQGFGDDDAVAKDFQHRLSGRIWADLLVRQLSKNPDVNENAGLAAAYDGLNDYVLHDETEKAPPLKVEPLFLRALKDLGENALETLADLPVEGDIDTGLKGALEVVRKKN